MKVELIRQEGGGGGEGREGRRMQPSTIGAFSYIISHKYHKNLTR